MKIMDELLDEFLKTWKKENNTEEAVYSAYHYDAMIAFAKYYHQSKVNNGVLDDVSVSLPTDEEITDWVCDEFKIDGLNFDEDVETQYGYLPEYFKSFAKWIISNER